MPTIFREKGIRYFFYSNEGSPREPVHIHAIKGNSEAKVTLDPVPEIAWNSGFHASELRDILEAVKLRRNLIESAWYDHFGN